MVTQAELEALPCWKEAQVFLLKRRWNTIKLAKWIQDQGDLTDVDLTFISAALSVYRRSGSQVVQDGEEKEPDPVEAKFDPVDELRTLYAMQRERINAARKFEKGLGGVLTKTLGNEIRIGTELLRTVHNLEVENEKLGRRTINNPKSVEGVTTTYGTKIAEVISNPKSRHKVLSAIQAVVAASKAKSEEEEKAAKVKA